MKSFHIILSVLVALIVVFSSLFVPINQSNRSLEAATSWAQFPVSIGNEKYIIDSFVIKESSTSYKMWYTHLTMNLSFDQLYNQLKTLNLDDLVNALQNYQWDSFMTNLADLNPGLPAIMNILDGIYTEIGYATSLDGKNWTVVDSSVLTGAGADFWTSVGFPSVIWDSAANNYKMWYTRLDSTLDQAKIQTIFTNLGNPATRRNAINDLLNSTGTVIDYVTSTDGINWGVSSLAFSGNASAYKLLNSVGAPSVILDGTTYKMWYTRPKTDLNSASLDTILSDAVSGNLDATDFLGIIDGTNLVIGYAESPDGSTWTNVNSGVFSGGTELWQSVADPCVVKSGITYYMWYTGIVSNLTNVTSWRSVFNGFLSANIPSLWNSMKTKTFANFIADLISINIGGLQTALTDTYGVIGLTTSADGITWSGQSTDLTRTSVNQWGGVGAPSVVKSTFQTEIWFSQGISALTWQNIVDRIQGVGDNSGLRYASVSTLPMLGGGGGGAPTPITGIGKVCWPLTPTGYTTVNITLTSEDEMCTIFIPKATLTQTKDYEELKCMSCSLMVPPPPAPAGKIVMVAYNVEPDGALFDPSVTVTIEYVPESVPKGINESSLKLAYFDSIAGVWTNLSNITVDTVKNIISGKTSHFSPFGILSDKGAEPAPPTPPPPAIPPPAPKPAIFVTSALTVSPTVVKPGEMVTIDVTVTNTGEQAGTYTVKLIINNVITKTQDVTLRMGGSKTITFTVSEDVAGTYNVVIDQLTGSFVVKEAPTQPPVITPPPPEPKPTNWGLIAVGIILGVVLVVLAGWLIITRREKM